MVFHVIDERALGAWQSGLYYADRNAEVVAAGDPRRSRRRAGRHRRRLPRPESASRRDLDEGRQGRRRRHGRRRHRQGDADRQRHRRGGQVRRPVRVRVDAEAEGPVHARRAGRRRVWQHRQHDGRRRSNATQAATLRPRRRCGSSGQRSRDPLERLDRRRRALADDARRLTGEVEHGRGCAGQLAARRRRRRRARGSPAGLLERGAGRPAGAGSRSSRRRSRPRRRRRAASAATSANATPIASGFAAGKPAVAPRRVRKDERVRARGAARARSSPARPRSSGTHSKRISRSAASSADGCAGRGPSICTGAPTAPARRRRAEPVHGVGRKDHGLPGP